MLKIYFAAKQALVDDFSHQFIELLQFTSWHLLCPFLPIINEELKVKRATDIRRFSVNTPGTKARSFGKDKSSISSK